MRNDVLDYDQAGTEDPEEVVDPTANVRNSSWWSCYFNMTNTICGAGVLSLPYAFANTGWCIGCILLVVGAYYSIMAMHLLMLCIAKTGCPTSMASIIKPFGQGAQNAMDALLASYVFGAACAYLVVIGDLMPDACKQMGGSGAFTSRYLWVLVGFSVALPLSIPHNIDFLKFTSGMAVAFLIFVMFIVFFYALPTESTGLDPCADQEVDDDNVCRGEKTFADGVGILDVLKVVSIFSFGFGCQVTTFPICNEMEAPTLKKLDDVWIYSILSALVLYIVVAVCGYSTYGENIKSDLLVNYPAVPLLSCARIMISSVVALSYPLQINPCRRALMTLMEQAIDQGTRASAATLRIRYYSVTAIFLAASLAVGLTVEDLGVVVALVGATGASMVMFIIPGFCFLYYFPQEEFEEVHAARACMICLYMHPPLSHACMHSLLIRFLTCFPLYVFRRMTTSTPPSAPASLAARASLCWRPAP